MGRQSGKRARIGDVVEITTSKGLAYAQYTHEYTKPPRYGSLVRVLRGVYPQRPSDISALIRQKELFVTFFQLNAELRRTDSLFRVIGSEPIPEWAIPFPVFRNGVPDRDRIVRDWWLWDGEKEWKVGKMTLEQIRSYPGLGLMNTPALMEMIENGWTSWYPEARE